MKRLILVCVASIVLPAMVHAESASLGYDKYQADEKSAVVKPASSFKKIVDAPALSVRGIKTALRKFFVWIETYHVPEKTVHVYEEITDRGIYPIKTDIGDRHGDPAGVEFNYGMYTSDNVSLGGGKKSNYGIQYLKEFDLPSTVIGNTIEINSWGQAGQGHYKDYGIQYTIDDFLSSNNYLKNTFRYRDNPQEDYFGEGPNLSIADGSSFQLEETSCSLALGHIFSEKLTAEIGGMFSYIDISEARDNTKRSINQSSHLDGYSGSHMLALGCGIEHDTLDNSLDPKKGGYRRLKVSYYEGVDGDDFGYVKYRFDCAEYFPIGEYLKFLYWDSAIGMRLSGEMNDDLNNDRIPFYDLATLGGGHSVRGYRYNRFFDENSLLYSLEYRYNIWSMKNYKVDGTVFFDCGWIFDEFSDFEFSKYKEGYGVGWRLIVPRFTIAFEAAHSDEGTEFYVKMRPLF
ncbi:MAG: BamA/TamA family outer membrane protein [Candidatus Omnitrophica bacterium]|nr:BamA/TamA family outer membrane protein [Candidatus Omnitrophota bacterium]